MATAVNGMDVWLFSFGFLQSRYAGGHCQCGARAKCKVTIQSGNHNHEVLCVERSFRELQVCGLMVILGAGEGKSSIAITKLRNLKKKKFLNWCGLQLPEWVKSIWKVLSGFVRSVASCQI